MVRLEFTLTSEDILAFRQAHFLRRRLRRVVLIAVTSFIMTQIFFHKKHDSLTVTITSGCFALLIFSLLVFYVWSKETRTPSDIKSMIGPQQFIFSDNGVEYINNQGQGKFNWSTIVNFKRNEKAEYLYIDEQRAFIIPIRAFANEQEKSEFQRIANRNMGLNS